MRLFPTPMTVDQVKAVAAKRGLKITWGAPKEKTTETMTAVEVGKLIGLGRNAVYDAAARGEIPSIRIGRRLVFNRAAVLAWFEGRTR